MSAATHTSDRFALLLRRLSDKSVEDYYNPFEHFRWPDSLPEDAWWMTPSLKRTHGTPSHASLSDLQRRGRSKWGGS